MKTSLPHMSHAIGDEHEATQTLPDDVSAKSSAKLFVGEDLASIDAGIHFLDVDNGDGIIFIEEDIFSDYTEVSTVNQEDYIEFDLELGDVFDFDFAMDQTNQDNTVDVLLAQGADFDTIASSMNGENFDNVDMVVFGANSNTVAGETMHDIFANLSGVRRCTHDKVSVDDAAWTQGLAEHNIGGKTYIEFSNDNDVSLLIAKTSLEINHG